MIFLFGFFVETVRLSLEVSFVVSSAVVVRLNSEILRAAIENVGR